MATGLSETGFDECERLKSAKADAQQKERNKDRKKAGPGRCDYHVVSQESSEKDVARTAGCRHDCVSCSRILG